MEEGGENKEGMRPLIYLGTSAKNKMIKFPFNVKAHLRKVHFVLTVAARADKEAGLLFTVGKILSRFARQRKKYNTYLLTTSSAINTKYFNYLKKNISFNGQGKT